MKPFTEEQLAYLNRHYVRTKETGVPVRDGVAHYGDTLWWRCEEGPEEIVLKEGSDHDRNVRENPQAYQLSPPRTRLQYLD